MALRCNLDGSDVEVLANNFRNPYEVAVDSFGNLWQSDMMTTGIAACALTTSWSTCNYGYVDELTGAGWSARRTNLDKDFRIVTGIRTIRGSRRT